MFSGLRSDSVALSHVWLGLSGGRFQSDGELRIAAATVWRGDCGHSFTTIHLTGDASSCRTHWTTHVDASASGMCQFTRLIARQSDVL